MNNLDVVLRDEIDARLKQVGEWQYTKWPRPAFPPFKRSAVAAENLLRVFPADRYPTILVLRDRSLRAVREHVLRDRTLIVPDKLGERLVLVPRSALYDNTGAKIRPALIIDPLPHDCSLFTGTVNLVVAGCLGFNLHESRLYGFDACATEGLLDHLCEESRLTANVIIVAVASDAQEVEGWPVEALSDVVVHGILTPTRLIVPTTGGVYDLNTEVLTGLAGVNEMTMQADSPREHFK